MLTIADEYVSENNTIQTIDDENDYSNITHRLLLLSIPNGVLLLPLIDFFYAVLLSLCFHNN